MRRTHVLILTICSLLIVTLAVYVGGYYYVTAELPWQQQPTAAELFAKGTTSTPAVIAQTQPPKTTTAGVTSIGSGRGVLSRSAAVISHSTMQEGSISSAIMGKSMPFLIYLPPGYTDVGNTTRYPVAYLLHGAPGNYKDWNGPGMASATADAMIGAGKLPPMILVMPEGLANLSVDSEWANGTGTPQAESYLVQEVIPFVDAHYRTVADAAHRAVGGLSTGGYGGVNMALHHPDVFSTAFALSGTYTAPKSLLGQTLFPDNASRVYNSPMSYVAAITHPQQLHVYLAVGKQDKLDNTVQETQQMEQALVAAKVPHLVQYDQGAHSWTFWALHLVNALSYFAANLPPTQ